MWGQSLHTVVMRRKAQGKGKISICRRMDLLQLSSAGSSICRKAPSTHQWHKTCNIKIKKKKTTHPNMYGSAKFTLGQIENAKNEMLCKSRRQT